ncbi:MAG: pilus assembly protein HicB [Bacteroidales bacterium]|nr:pilus assembly protein HicB [Bacteroidales bacterium]
MTVNAIIEKGNDGLFAVRSETVIGRTCLCGFGDSVEDAKEDFLMSVDEAIEDSDEQKLSHPNRADINVVFTYDLPSFFNYFDMFNTSKFASYAGINESKMRQYKSGISYPGEKTTKKILSAVRQIAAELSTVML